MAAPLELSAWLGGQPGCSAVEGAPPDPNSTHGKRASASPSPSGEMQKRHTSILLPSTANDGLSPPPPTTSVGASVGVSVGVSRAPSPPSLQRRVPSRFRPVHPPHQSIRVTAARAQAAGTPVNPRLLPGPSTRGSRRCGRGWRSPQGSHSVHSLNPFPAGELCKGEAGTLEPRQVAHVCPLAADGAADGYWRARFRAEPAVSQEVFQVN